MVTLRKSGQIQESPANTKRINKDEVSSGYEQCRDQRIKENMERMQKLGILDLSSKLKSGLHSPKISPRKPFEKRSPQPSSSLPPSSEPRRRSSRLQNVNPVSYVEIRTKKEGKSEEEKDLIKEGNRPEIYTEEHEKLLGSCESSWELFVDGYGPDGKRIYDPVKGKTCHQCRQKTLGHRTRCSNCSLVQGQFCGDCLYTRYGENVLEANQNPNWICPVCRGICNCSLCRLAKGWVPTGYMYRRILKLGFKSVAHYLIQTLRAETNSEENEDAEVPTSAKRSLPFEDAEEFSNQKETVSSNEKSKPFHEDSKDTEEVSQQSKTLSLNETLNPLSEVTEHDDEVKAEKLEAHNVDGRSDEKVKSSFDDSKDGEELPQLGETVNVDENPSILSIDNDDQFKEPKSEKAEPENSDSKLEVTPESEPKRKKRPLATEPNPNSIAGRLRRRRMMSS